MGIVRESLGVWVLGVRGRDVIGFSGIFPTMENHGPILGYVHTKGFYNFGGLYWCPSSLETPKYG